MDKEPHPSSLRWPQTSKKVFRTAQNQDSELSLLQRGEAADVGFLGWISTGVLVIAS